MKWLLILAILLGPVCATHAAEESLGTKIKKVFEPTPTPDSITQTSKACRAESFADSVSDGFAKEEEDFADPISDCDAEEQIKAKKSECVADAGSRRNSVANSSGNSFAAAAFRAGREKRRAKRQSFA